MNTTQHNTLTSILKRITPKIVKRLYHKQYWLIYRFYNIILWIFAHSGFYSKPSLLKWVSILNIKYAGKELMHCCQLGNTIIFFSESVNFCCNCSTQLGPPVIYRENLDYFSSDIYFENLDRIIALNQTEEALCRGCSSFKKMVVPKFNKKYFFRNFTITNFLKCNLNCIYCGGLMNSPDYIYSILHIIKQMKEEGFIHPNCFFSWGGGEPTLYKEFEDVVSFLMENKYLQLINSSGLKYSPLILKGLEEGALQLQISVDSGTQETFAKVKGLDGYEKVWGNIKKYCEHPKNVTIKYIIFALNSKKEEINDFIDKCLWANVKNIEISLEASQVNGNTPTWGKVTDREIEARFLMNELAKQNNINVKINYIWEYDSEVVEKVNLHKKRDKNQAI